MQIIPAIDLKGGRCVRLIQGQADNETVYGDDPVAMARKWVAEGAECLHVVDLDGAFSGQPCHTRCVAAMADAVPIPLELGGGMRTSADVRQALDGGVARVIIGTRALTEPDAVRALVCEFGAHLAVGIDARNGLVRVKGWVESSDVQAVDLARDMDAIGVDTIIYTDIATDGMLGGTSVAGVDAVCRAVGCRVVASGGISAIADITALRDLGHENLVGAIVGKALYEGRVTVAELIRAAE